MCRLGHLHDPDGVAQDRCRRTGDEPREHRLERAQALPATAARLENQSARALVEVVVYPAGRRVSVRCRWFNEARCSMIRVPDGGDGAYTVMARRDATRHDTIWRVDTGNQ